MEVKPEVNIADLFEIHSNLMAILLFTNTFCNENNLPFVITSLKTDKVSGRVSSSHRDGRAADVSLKYWPEYKIIEFETKVNGIFYDQAAISKSDNRKRACVIHDSGKGRHIHLQVEP